MIKCDMIMCPTHKVKRKIKMLITLFKDIDANCKSNPIEFFLN